MAAKRKPFRARPVEEGQALLLAPEGLVAASIDGVEYRVADDGSLAVPASAVAALADHGCTPAPTSPDESA